MQYVECATFHLNTCDINASDITADYPTVSSFGTVNNNRTDFTFYNVDFRTILGDMYDEYDKFNIKLSSMMYSLQTPYGANNDERCLKINVAGLPYNNSSYHQKLGNTGFTTMGSFNLIQNNANQIYFNDDNVFTIWKPPAMLNIRVYLTTQYDIPPPFVINNLFPQFDLYFRVYGVKKV